MKLWHLQANRSVSDTAAVKKLLAEGEEAANFIKTFVVQAKLNKRGNFGELIYYAGLAGPLQDQYHQAFSHRELLLHPVVCNVST